MIFHILKFALLIGIFTYSATIYCFPQKLTLNECIAIAQQNSYTGKIIAERQKERNFEYQAFVASLLPELNLNLNLPGLIREINQITQPDGTQQFLQQSQLFSFGGISLTQRFASTGTVINLSSGLDRIDILEPNKAFLWRANPLQIGISQPIFQFNSLYWENEIQEIRYSQISKQYKEDLEDLAVEVTNSFFNVYISSMNLQNAEDNIAINDTLYTLSKGRFELGTIAENDLLQSELALLNAKNEFEQQKVAYQKALAELNILLNNNEIKDLTLDPPTKINILNISEEEAFQFALENRSLTDNLKLTKLQAERNLDMVERNSGFNAQVQASYGLNQSATNLNNAYQNLLDQERFNLSIQVPIFSWGANQARVESAVANLEQVNLNNELQMQNFEIEMKFQIIGFMQLQQRVLLAEKSNDIAARRFEVAKNRYLIGKIDLNSLFIAQNEKNFALQDYVNSLRQYWIAYYNVRRLTLWDFSTNSPIKY